jgi:hypothetical protein
MEDQAERLDDSEESTRRSFDALKADLWTSLPVIFKKHDTEKNCAHVQPAIKQKHVRADGSSEWVDSPLLQDIPLHYPGGGGATWTFPVKDGDEGILIVSSRSFDKWWQEGGIQEQNEFRTHHLSDAFVIPGIRSQKRKLSNVNSTTAQLRSDDGNSYVEFDPVNNKAHIKMSGDITLESTTKITLKAPTIVTDGDTLLGGPSATTPVSRQGTVDTGGFSDTSNLATKVKAL